MAENVIPQTAQNGQTESPKIKQQTKFGYVYIIKAETGEYKIGRSRNVPERMKLFAVKLPFDFEIIHTFPCADAIEAERQLHLIFRDKRRRGEWFNLTDEDVEILKTVHEFCNLGEFQKADKDGQLWGMPELWMNLPECESVKNSLQLDMYSTYHRSMFGLSEVFRLVWPKISEIQQT